MTLTTVQVAEKLGVSSGVVRAMVRRGELTAKNYAEGERRNLKFDSKVVNALKKANGPVRKTRVLQGPGKLTAIEASLASLHSKVDNLIRMWQ